MATVKDDVTALRATLGRIDTATTAIGARLDSQAVTLTELKAKLPDEADQAALDQIVVDMGKDADTLEAMGQPDAA